MELVYNQLYSVRTNFTPALFSLLHKHVKKTDHTCYHTTNQKLSSFFYKEKGNNSETPYINTYKIQDLPLTI